MNLLAFDTSTEVLSIAVSRSVDGQLRVLESTGVGGAQASLGLIAAVQDLMQQAQLDFADLDAICFGQGPGSFTGLRTACSVAQGFALGGGVPVLPVDSLLAVAEEARWSAGDVPHMDVVTLLDARMDEMYAAHYCYDDGCWRLVQDAALMKPQDFVLPEHAGMAGNVFKVYADRLPSAPAVHAVPTATAMLRLAPGLIAAGCAVTAAQALPRYVRDKVAKTTLERAAEKATLQRTP